jgi:DNA-binding GntR family transcriptional regulator
MSGVLTKKEQVYNRIRRAIITGDLKPGEVMNEAEMAARFGSGKTPTREALLLLSHEKFIEALPRVGYLVTRPTMQDILETFHLRIVLEVEATTLAASRITAGALATLQENIEREEQLSLQPPEEQNSQAAALNRDFHTTIARIGGNSRLAEMVQDLVDNLERMLVTDPYLVDARQHKKILEALTVGDPTMAGDAMRKHIEQTRGRVLNRY